MDFPIFHIDFIGNRLLIAVDAILHVLINHTFAIGALPIIAMLEFTGIQRQDRQWDVLAYQLLKVIFIITTTVGALTGVGIWFSAALVNPAAIGSLIRVFFWGWFAEWLVFISEISFIMLYFLTWQKTAKSIESKLKHNRYGIALAVFSWVTMAIIVAILGFMMDPGSWHGDHALLSGLFNPMYLPQLAFRTTLSMVMGGVAMLCLVYCYTRQALDFRRQVVSAISQWTSLWMVLLVAAAFWYYQIIPSHMLANIPVAITTQAYTEWNANLKWLLIIGSVYLGWVLLASVRQPGAVHGAKYVTALLLLFLMLGQFERVREFIRKPYIIGNYMYANGFRVDEYPLLQRDGVLQYATYTGIRNITADNQVSAGREVFQLTCTRCHTVKGVNGIRDQLLKMYGAKPWDAAVIAAYLEKMNGARYFMPPFPGNKAELKALAAYLATLRQRATSYDGVQVTGIPKPDRISTASSYAVLPDASSQQLGH